MSADPLWAFPFKGGCVSKPPLPYVSTTEDDYEFRGASLGKKVPVMQARYYCCWIEGATHALLGDPYLRWFVEDYNVRKALSKTAWICENPFGDDQKELADRYTDGVAAMAYLAARLRLYRPVEWFASLEEGQADFDDSVEPLLAAFRLEFRDNDAAAADNMGDPAMLLLRLLPALRLFVAYNWSGNEFQRQFLGYGCSAVSSSVQKCAGVDGLCPFFGKDIEYFNNGEDAAVLVTSDPSAGTALLDMTDAGGAKQELFLYEGDKMVLAEELSAMPYWNGRWSLMSGQACTGCDQLRIVQKKLVTLPFVLYINIARTPTTNPAQLRYDPNELIIGPTRDNHYAIYQLVCRLEKIGAHYVADIRKRDGTFTRYDFSKQTSNQRIPEVDTGCTYLVWRRVDK